MTHAIVHTRYPELNEERFEVLVAGRPVGYAATTDRGHDVWILELTVHPDCRGRRLASVLLDAVLARNTGRVLALSCEPFGPRPEDAVELSAEAVAAWYIRNGFRHDTGTCMIRPVD